LSVDGDDYIILLTYLKKSIKRKQIQLTKQGEK